MSVADPVDAAFDAFHSLLSELSLFDALLDPDGIEAVTNVRADALAKLVPLRVEALKQAYRIAVDAIIPLADALAAKHRLNAVNHVGVTSTSYSGIVIRLAEERLRAMEIFEQTHAEVDGPADTVLIRRWKLFSKIKREKFSAFDAQVLHDDVSNERRLMMEHRLETANGPTPTKPKRSTERGEGRAKLIAALTEHHKYADGGCLNLEPIDNNELARLAKVSKSTASGFFHKQFAGRGKYRRLCQDAGSLADALKALNGEFTPAELQQRFSETAEAVRRQIAEE